MGRGKRTPSREMRSRRWRGMTVTSSISARKATSGWVRPGGSGSAMVVQSRRLSLRKGSSHRARSRLWSPTRLSWVGVGAAQKQKPSWRVGLDWRRDGRAERRGASLRWGNRLEAGMVDPNP